MNDLIEDAFGHGLRYWLWLPLFMAATAALMVAAAVVLVTFRHHRLRWLNVVICLSIALVAARSAAEWGRPDWAVEWTTAAAWGLLMVLTTVVLVMMLKIAFVDPRRRSRKPNPRGDGDG